MMHPFDMNRNDASADRPSLGGDGGEHGERRLIEALYPLGGGSGRLTEAEWSRLFTHLREGDCSSCQGYFEERRASSLGGAAHAPTEGADGRGLLTERELEAIALSLPIPFGATEVNDKPIENDNKTAALRSAIPGRAATQGPVVEARHSTLKARRPVERWVGMAAFAAAACALVFLAPRLFESRDLHERIGGVSAVAYCFVHEGRAESLEKRKGFCPPAAEIGIHAMMAPEGTMGRVTVVSCTSDDACAVVASEPIGPDGDATVAGPRAIPGTPQRVFAIWSSDEIADDAVTRVVRKLRKERLPLFERAVLPFDQPLPQFAFTLHAQTDPPSQ